MRRPGERVRERRSGPLSGLKVLGSGVPVAGEVSVDLMLESTDDSALVAIGTVTAGWEGDCSRCLESVTGEVSAEVRELFGSPPGDGAKGSGSPPGDSDIYPLRGDQADLEPLARDAVLLALPLAPLCAEDCAGLCPVCGANRNVADCGCDTTVRDERWAVLDVLKDK